LVENQLMTKRLPEARAASGSLSNLGLPLLNQNHDAFLAYRFPAASKMIAMRRLKLCRAWFVLAYAMPRGCAAGASLPWSGPKDALIH
jgi:hypothetical protein